MGEQVGELPRKFFSSHCLQNESNELRSSNTEGTENFPDLPQRIEVEAVKVAETKYSPSKSLAVLKVDAVNDPVSKDDEDVFTENIRLASQECLLSSSDEGSGALEIFLRERLDALSGQSLEKIMEVDPFGMLAPLE